MKDILFVVPTAALADMLSKKHGNRYLFVPVGAAVCGYGAKCVVVHPDWLFMLSPEEVVKAKEWLETSIKTRLPSKLSPIVFLESETL